MSSLVSDRMYEEHDRRSVLGRNVSMPCDFAVKLSVQHWKARAKMPLLTGKAKKDSGGWKERTAIWRGKLPSWEVDRCKDNDFFVVFDQNGKTMDNFDFEIVRTEESTISQYDPTASFSFDQKLSQYDLRLPTGCDSWNEGTTTDRRSQVALLGYS